MKKANLPSKKKTAYPISTKLYGYLNQYSRITKLPLQYDDMSRFFTSIPVLDAKGEETLWETVMYEEYEAEEIYKACCEIYALLKTDGEVDVIEHLEVDRIDYCMFGNTHPYRVRIINRLNDNYDHFYIKKVDASRIYGLELECLLSPSIVSFLIDDRTIIEEHVAGIPGDLFMEKKLEVSRFEQIRIAKEFIKFNERCFVRLLGDMRAYNFVVDITPDIEGNQYRIRPIDFDQQSYEGWRSFYLPQYFKDNNDIINLGLKHMSVESVRQYQLEERSLIARRARSEMERLKYLLKCMQKDRISKDEKVRQLAEELGEHHHSTIFKDAATMGDIVYRNIRLVLNKEFKQSFLKF